MTAARAREQSQSLCLGSSLRLGLVPVGLTVEDRAGRNATSLLPPGDSSKTNTWGGSVGRGVSAFHAPHADPLA
jgi:hypothetical protein